jgi:hypothetical protein
MRDEESLKNELKIHGHTARKMFNDELLKVIVHDLRSMAREGKSVATLLRHVQLLFGHSECGLLCVKCFREAFNVGIASIKPIGGWCGFGGELTDEEVESFVGVILKDYRTSQEANANLPK